MHIEVNIASGFPLMDTQRSEVRAVSAITATLHGVAELTQQATTNEGIRNGLYIE
jgi:hypothetical protein